MSHLVLQSDATPVYNCSGMSSTSKGPSSGPCGSTPTIPAMARATNKERLARNIITIGGSGDQQALNMVAFQQALAIHASEQSRRAISQQEAEVTRLTQKLDQSEARANDVERDYRAQVQMVQDLRERLTESEVAMARLPQPIAEPEAEPQEIA